LLQLVDFPLDLVYHAAFPSLISLL